MDKWIRTAPVLALLVAGACSDGLGPADAIDDNEAADIVLEADAMAGGILFGQVLLVGFGADSDITIASGDVREFSRERDCPLGGNITLSGQIERTITDAAVEFSASASGSWNGCVRGHRRNDHTFTIDGTFAMSAFRRYVDRQPSGPQTASKSGSFTVTRDDGASRSCEYDVTSTRYPDEHRRTVVGTVCGREINREVTWNPSDG
jgi:hypothetical protein